MAEEWLEEGRRADGMGAYNVAVSNCADSAIRAVDAVAVMRLGRRSAGSRADAEGIIQAVFPGRNRKYLKRWYAFLLSLKNPAEHEGTLMTARQSADALRSAVRILERVHAEIAKEGAAEALRAAPGRAHARPGAAVTSPKAGRRPPEVAV